MEKISPEGVRAQVDRFWAVMTGKMQGRLEEMYSPTALVFTGKGKRSESAKLVAVRRSRQSPRAGSASRAEQDSIDVQIVAPDVAIAVCTYRYYKEKTDADGAKVQRDPLLARATLILQRDNAGVLRIVHEHLSATAPPEVEKPAG